MNPIPRKSDVDWKACWDGREEAPELLDMGDVPHGEDLIITFTGRSRWVRAPTLRLAHPAGWVYRREPDGCMRKVLSPSIPLAKDVDWRRTVPKRVRFCVHPLAVSCRGGRLVAVEAFMDGVGIYSLREREHIDPDWHHVYRLDSTGVIGYLVSRARNQLYECDACSCVFWNIEENPTCPSCFEKVLVRPSSHPACPPERPQKCRDLVPCGDAELPLTADEVKDVSWVPFRPPTLQAPVSCNSRVDVYLRWKDLARDDRQRVVEVLGAGFGPPKRWGETCEVRYVCAQGSDVREDVPTRRLEARRIGETTWHAVPRGDER